MFLPLYVPRLPLQRPSLEQAASTSPHAHRKQHRDHLRLLSCLLRCSERLKALEQNWHLYLLDFSSALPVFDGLRADDGEGGEGWRAPATADMVSLRSLCDDTRALAITAHTWSMCGSEGEGGRMVGVTRP